MIDISIEPGTRDGLEEVLSNPREIELDTCRILGVNLYELVDQVLRTTRLEVVRVNGTAVAAHYLNLIDPDLVMYGAFATPEAERIRLSLTKQARTFIRGGQIDYPNRTHWTVCPPDGPARAWLNLIGFHATDQYVDGLPLIYMHAPGRK
ncbi:hypothetical protein [Reyranella massiliensis]|uniref:hypothetical protein n=1 Tax=Reyranella massiliensis TaxID=445220 RepID=UPI0002F7E0A7|nr:hypothetical protein [Reyranella massiliensis]